MWKSECTRLCNDFKETLKMAIPGHVQFSHWQKPLEGTLEQTQDESKLVMTAA